MKMTSLMVWAGNLWRVGKHENDEISRDQELKTSGEEYWKRAEKLTMIDINELWIPSWVD
jgi:hypothetical protein